MLSIPQLACGLLLFIGAAIWWVARSLNRDELEKQIEQTLEVLDSAAALWLAKLADASVSAYAQTYLRCIDAERGGLLEMQATLATGDRLSVKQLVRLDKLVAEHLVGNPAMVAVPVAHPGR